MIHFEFACLSLDIFYVYQNIVLQSFPPIPSSTQTLYLIYFQCGLQCFYSSINHTHREIAQQRPFRSGQELELNTNRVVQNRHGAALLLLLLLLLLNKVGSARLGESDVHPISPKTPAPQYHIQTERRERERKQKTAVGIEKLRPIKKHWPCS